MNAPGAVAAAAADDNHDDDDDDDHNQKCLWIMIGCAWECRSVSSLLR
jgi:hypothetical protein